jgi:hypothetical protein
MGALVGNPSSRQSTTALTRRVKVQPDYVEDDAVLHDPGKTLLKIRAVHRVVR